MATTLSDFTPHSRGFGEPSVAVDPIVFRLEAMSDNINETAYRVSKLANDLCGNRPPETSDGSAGKPIDDSIAGRIETAVDNLWSANARANDAMNRIRNRFSLAD